MITKNYVCISHTSSWQDEPQPVNQVTMEALWRWFDGMAAAREREQTLSAAVWKQSFHEAGDGETAVVGEFMLIFFFYYYYYYYYYIVCIYFYYYYLYGHEFGF